MSADLVRTHYGASSASADLLTTIKGVVDALPPPITASSLAAFDQFHVRGLAATIELAGMLTIQPDSDILDAGSGLGGPSRFLAEAFGCHVTGVDLTPSFVEVSRYLAGRAGLGDRATYEIGDLLALPFAAGRFDIVITQHVVMNISDRLRAYREMGRVLKRGGRFAFYDIIAADDAPPPEYPVPWAETAATSTLLTEEQTRTVLQEAGLTPVTWTDVTAAAIAWFAQTRSDPAPGLSVGVVMGPRFAQMTANLARNVTEERLRLVMGVCGKPS